jgi:hypothetical protein
MCFVLKQLLHQNAHVYDSKHLHAIRSKCYFMSHYDAIAGRLIHGYENDEELRIALSMQQLQRINVPMIALQAEDDPLHAVSERISCYFVCSFVMFAGDVGTSKRKYLYPRGHSQSKYCLYGDEIWQPFWIL